MRSRVMLALVLGFAQAHVQAQQLGPASVRDSYGLVSLPSELRERQIDLTLANHTVVSGETLESILLSQGVVATPRALGLVLEANPDLENVNQILAGTELLVRKRPAAPPLLGLRRRGVIAHRSGCWARWVVFPAYP